MSVAPHALSAHPSAWTAHVASGVRRDDAASGGISCHLCGQPLQGWQDVYHLNDDHADDTPGNLVASCPLCHLPQHLNRTTIDEEAVLIWLPEMTQRAVIVLVRAAHVALFRHGTAPYATSLPARQESEAASAAFATLRTLETRAAAAAQLLGSNSPRVLGAALMSLPPDVYAERIARLGGVRLLPRGRLYRDSRDIYGQILRDWALPTPN